MEMTSARLPDNVDDLKALVLETVAANRAQQEDAAAKQSAFEEQIDLLQQQLRLLLHKRFGRSSEQTPREQLHLFNEAEISVAGSDDEEAEARVVVKVILESRGDAGHFPKRCLASR